MAIVVPIVSTFNDKGIKNANKQIGGFDKTVKTLGKSVAGVFAVQKIASFFTASVKGAMADNKAQIQLAKSIRNTTNATSFQIAGVEDFIRATQFSTGILDDNLRPALNSLVLATSDVTKSQELLNLALDISAGTGRDLESVTTALAKAAGGQFTSLQRLGVGLSKSVLETKNLDTITGALATKFSGQAAAAAQTFAGQMGILNAKAQEAQETIGFAFIEAIQMFSGTGGAGKAFGDLLLVISDNIANLIVGIATVIKSVQDFTRSLEQSNPTLFRYLEALGNVAVLIFKLGTLPLTFFTEAGEKTRDLAKTNKLAGDRYQLMAEKLYGFKSATDNVIPSIEKASKATKGLSDAQKAVINANIKLQESVVDNLQDSLSGAESSLDSVTSKFNDLRDAISGTVTDVVDFGAAIETEDFLKTITAQADSAKSFADKVKQLIVLGLSERGIRELLDSGFEAGNLIADELIAGGATIVNQVNTLLSAVQTVADTVGEFGAKTFYQQGVTQGEALVAGIKFALESAKLELDRLRESLTSTTKTGATEDTIPGTTPSGTGAKTVVVKPGDTLGKIAAANNLSLKSILDANAKFTTDPKYKGGSTIFSGTTVKIPKFAKGGIVNSPTIGMIGEAGPEAIVPLSGSNAGIGATYNIVVNAGIGTSGSQVGREIVDAIKKFEKTSGPVFASA
jgi:LysM repeat protein